MAKPNLLNGEEDELQRIVQQRLALYGPNTSAELVTQLFKAAMEEAREKRAYQLQ
ncbi:Hypothetical predicted protein, partial [Pelobates cultripes]